MKTTWDERVDGWHTHVSDTPAFAEIRDSLLQKAHPTSSDVAVDLGAGTGFVTIPLARQSKQVLAVDFSEPMLQALKEAAETSNIQTLAIDLDRLDLAAGSVDLIVSNYALHHLTDKQKGDLVRRSFTWLRPGGRIVIADMMLGRGLSARDRSIAKRKVSLLLRRGPAGVWRIAKNVARFTLRVGTERPIPPQRWAELLRAAGFEQVEATDVVSEAGLVSGVKSSSAAG